MKILVNWRDGICFECGQGECATVRGGKVICAFCEGENIIDKHGNKFKPKWKFDSRNSARKLWANKMRRRGENLYEN